MKHNTVSLVALTAAWTWSSAAAAQTVATSTGGGTLATNPAEPSSEQAAPSADNGQIGDIIVTAQRRAESLQKSSVAISVLTGSELEKLTQPKDLTLLVPGVQVGAGNPIPQIYIRGIGDFGANALSNPAIAENVDGIYIGRPTAIAGQFFDLERVELLKGPQGTLYGRNASGGALNVITRRPSFDRVGGNLDGEIGNYSNQAVDGAFNLPVSGTLAMRAAFQIVDRSGYLTDGANDDKHQSGRLRALWKPSGDVSLLLGIDYTHLGGKGGSLAVKSIPGLSPWTGEADPISNVFLQAHQPFPGAFFPITADKIRQDIKTLGLNAEFNWNLGSATLTILPAYRYTKLNYATLPGGFIFSEAPEISKQTSLEARLGNSSVGLKWVVGAYYFKEDQRFNGVVPVGLLQNYVTDHDPSTVSYAIFGQATYSLTDAFRVIGGIRYTVDRRKLENGVTYAVAPDVSFNGPSGSTPAGPCYQQASPCAIDRFEGRKTFRSTSFKAGFEYDLAPQNLIYTTFSTGFKAGGFNQNSLATPVGTTQAEAYNPEKLTAYEVGSRNRFLNGKLQINLEGFYWKYQDHQEPRVSVTSRGVIALSFTNAGSATSYGGNIDIVARPTNADTIHLGVEYDHTRYNSFIYSQPIIPFKLGAPVAGISTGCAVSTVPGTSFATAVVDCSGKQMAHSPKWSGVVSYEHVFSFAGGATLTPRADVQFASARWLNINFTPVERARGYAVLDADLTFQPLSRAWSISIYAQNVTEKAVYTSGSRNPFANAPYFAGSIQNPRLYGARFSINF